MKADDSMTDLSDTEEDFRFAQQELAKIRTSYDDAALIDLCRARSKGVFPVLEEAANHVAFNVRTALTGGLPWSLVRIGDGEGNVLAMRDFGNETARKCFNRIISQMASMPLSTLETTQLTDFLISSVVASDVVGFRSIDRTFSWTELEILESHWDRELRGFLGMLSARRFLERELVRDSFRNCILTSAWIHLSLIEHLPEIFDVAPQVVVVTGIGELAGEFRRRLGSRLREFIIIQREGYRPEKLSNSHYHSDLPRIVDYLENFSRQTLVLVGAGIFGKIYCNLPIQLRQAAQP